MTITATFGMLSGFASLDPRFDETTLYEGMKYCTDSNYILTKVSYQYAGMNAILTTNGERNMTTTSNYLTFSMPLDGTVNLVIDSRVTSLPE
mgnify:CR=1 FL=1